MPVATILWHFYHDATNIIVRKQLYYFECLIHMMTRVPYFDVSNTLRIAGIPFDIHDNILPLYI